jgi:nucleoid-associated protein YgaU
MAAIESEAADAPTSTTPAQSAAPSQPAEPNYIVELEQLAGLVDKGIITQEEFEAKKKSLLGL